MYDLREEIPAAGWDEAHVAVDQGRVVGFTATQFAAWHRRQGIQHLYVSPDWRLRGVGQALVATVKVIAIRNRASHLWLETSNVNVLAVRAFRRMGFELCGLDLTFYKGTPEHDEVGMLMSQDLVGLPEVTLSAGSGRGGSWTPSSRWRSVAGQEAPLLGGLVADRCPS